MRWATKCDFSYGHYKEILEKCLKQGYKFIGFEDTESNADNKKSIILRHDIDYSVDSALEMAKIENKLGIKAAYFVLLNGPYNIFRKKEKIQKIIKLGHRIGLHYNTDSEEQIIKETSLIENYFGIKVKSVSQHNPSISKPMRFTKQGISDAYSEKFTKKIKYISDSMQNWREGCLCSNINKYDHLQVLTHPIIWSKDSSDKKDIYTKLYDGIMKDVKKEVFFVFKGQAP